MQDLKKRFSLHQAASIRPIFRSSFPHSQEEKERDQNLTSRSAPQALRSPFVLRSEAIKGSLGSCYLEHGPSTKIICTLSPPSQSTNSNCISQGSIKCQCRFAGFTTSALDSSQLERALESALEGIVLLDRIPGSMLLLNFCILEAETTNSTSASLALANLLPNLLNAAIVTLVNGAVEIQDLVSCCQVAWNEKEGILVDPSLSELERASASCSICYSQAHNEILSFNFQAAARGLKKEAFQEQELIQWAIDGAVGVRKLMEKALPK